MGSAQNEIKSEAAAGRRPEVANPDPSSHQNTGQEKREFVVAALPSRGNCMGLRPSGFDSSSLERRHWLIGVLAVQRDIRPSAQSEGSPSAVENQGTSPSITALPRAKSVERFRVAEHMSSVLRPSGTSRSHPSRIGASLSIARGFSNSSFVLYAEGAPVSPTDPLSHLPRQPHFRWPIPLVHVRQTGVMVGELRAFGQKSQYVMHLFFSVS